jgi:hypothetical protein
MANDPPPLAGLPEPPQRWSHDWYPLDSYLSLHHSYMDRLEREGLIEANHLVITSTTGLDGSLIEVGITGLVECVSDITIGVDKFLEVRRLPTGVQQVRGKEYRYHARHRKLERNLIRYDTAHGLDDLHVHIYDLVTGEMTSIPRIPKALLPTLGDFIRQAVELGREAEQVADLSHRPRADREDF